VSPRLQIFLTVAVLALMAAGTAVAITVATRQSPVQPKALEGKPPLGPVIPSPAEKQIRQAYKSWPKGSIAAMERLGREYPKDPVVQLYRGLALYWAGYLADAEVVLRSAKKIGRDTPWEVQADNLLHPQFQINYPTFVPTRADPLLEQGARLQTQGKQHSALEVFEQAARKRPKDCDAAVAVAVAHFDKDRLDASFSRLGPLTRKFPRCQTVRYYLGLLLAWTGQRDPAIVQFQKAVELGPNTERGKGAAEFLKSVTGGGGGTG
jgi:tetratricopeptide (TPR) repeat protein